MRAEVLTTNPQSFGTDPELNVWSVDEYGDGEWLPCLTAELEGGLTIKFMDKASLVATFPEVPEVPEVPEGEGAGDSEGASKGEGVAESGKTEDATQKAKKAGEYGTSIKIKLYKILAKRRSVGTYLAMSRIYKCICERIVPSQLL